MAIMWVAGVASAFYFPGAAVKEYDDMDPIEVDVNGLSSVRTHLPYEYYSLPFCKPMEAIEKGESELLGEILLGDHVQRSPYVIKMKESFTCRAVCVGMSYTAAQVGEFRDRITEEYSANLIVDRLPVIVQAADDQNFHDGVALGVHAKDASVILFNHIAFTLRYHTETSGKRRIIAVTAMPYSVRHPASGCPAGAFDPQKAEPVVLSSSSAIVHWTYGVKWEETADTWETRWDPYLRGAAGAEVHWFAILNSVLIALFLSLLVAMIMLRTLRRDIQQYNSDDDAADETGWKMVHANVFRPPPALPMLAVLVGTGVQLACVCALVLLFALFGFMAPGSRGMLFTALIFVFVHLGACGGFASARLMKAFGQVSWRVTLATATMLPATCFTVFFIVNWFVWRAGSAAAVPVSTMASLLGIWLLIELPVVFLGGVLGYRKAEISFPVRTSIIPRHLPDQSWYLHPVFTVAMGGVLPFGAVFIELYFVLTSLWHGRFYYVFGFLFVVFIILAITCAEITVVMVYFQLCAEDYRWWWRAFFTAGSSGLYLFAYAVFFFVSTLRITKFASVLMFFGYMGLASFVFAIMTGTLGFLAAFWFVRRIYAALHLD